MSAIPCHVAFIMDGNGRWAVKRGLSRLKGHREGIKKAELVIDYCLRRGIKVVSLFVFSTENWKRAEREVAGLFKLSPIFQKEESGWLCREICPDCPRSLS